MSAMSDKSVFTLTIVVELPFEDGYYYSRQRNQEALQSRVFKALADYPGVRRLEVTTEMKPL